MQITLKNGQSVTFRKYDDRDFIDIQQMNHREGWNNLVERGEETKASWKNSNIAYVVTVDENIIAYIRGLTDEQITLYICELLIQEEFRSYGIGRELLEYVHRLYPKTRIEMLASSSSQTYYEHLGYRSFYGYRKTIDE